jgi:zinc transporter ZupT
MDLKILHPFLLLLPTMSDLWLPLGLALSSLAGFALGTLPFRVRSSHDSHDLEEAVEASVIEYLYPVTVAFFVGYLAVMAVPHSLAEAPPGLLAVVLGIGVMALLSRKILKRDPCCETGHKHDPLGWAFFAALSVCAMNDGVLIGLIDPPWLSGMNLGMLVHKVTSSFALALALGHWHYRGGRLWTLGLVNAAISPLFYYAGRSLRGIEALPLETLLGFSVGILAYTVFSGMLPHSGKMLKRKPSAWVGFGAALAVAVALGLVHRGMH